jgi:hypothetical protein
VCSKTVPSATRRSAAGKVQPVRREREWTAKGLRRGQRPNREGSHPCHFKRRLQLARKAGRNSSKGLVRARVLVRRLDLD